MFAIVKRKVHKQSDPFFCRASVSTNSIVDTSEEKSFEVVFATETPVFRYGWEENFNEVLSVNPDHMRLERLEAKALPLCDAHSTWSVTKQMGRVDSYSIKDGIATARVIFSTQEQFAGIWQDIKAGIIRNISVGYKVYKFLREMVTDNTIPTYRAIDWEPLEISLAPVPADFKSGVRSEKESYDVEIEYKNQEKFNRNSNMENETTVTEQTTTTVVPVTQERQVAPTVTTVIDENKIRQDAITAERTRATDIRTAVRAAKLDDSFAEDLIGRGVAIDAARTEIINKMAETDKTPNVRTVSTTAITVDETEKTRDAMSTALMHRANPGSVKLEDKAQDFKHMSLIEMARHCLIEKGEPNVGRLGPSEVVKRAIATTDYPTLLNSTVERAIRRTYDSIPAEWQHIAKRTTAKDFRQKTGIAVDGSVTFEEIAEGGEYKNSLLLTNDSAALKLKTFGRKITITRQAIINDDLSVFEKLPALIARGAHNFQAAKVWGLIINNGKAPDGTALFHNSHGNLGTAAALSETSLSAARVAMFKHKTPAGEPLAISPKIMLVPIELMTTAEKLMSGITANNTNDVNVFQNKYKIMTSPFLVDPKAYYLTSPEDIEGLVYAYLEGEEGLFIDKEISFDTDAVVTKARIDFDAAIWGTQGWYKNPGV